MKAIQNGLVFVNDDNESLQIYIDQKNTAQCRVIVVDDGINIGFHGLKLLGEQILEFCNKQEKQMNGGTK